LDNQRFFNIMNNVKKQKNVMISFAFWFYFSTFATKLQTKQRNYE